jgi:hypothetical protein
MRVSVDASSGDGGRKEIVDGVDIMVMSLKA